MVDLMYYLTNLLFFYIPLLNHYINVRSSIMFCLSCGDTYLSLRISLSCSFVIVSELSCGQLLETFIILLAILLPVKSPVASAVFDILLLYYYINLRSSITFCFSSGDIYISFFKYFFIIFIFKLFFFEFFETFVILPS